MGPSYAAMTMDAGQQLRFAELIDQHRGIVFKVAGTYAHGPDDRDDLAQEIAAQLWRAFPRYDESRRFSTWMYRIALNVAISQVRSNTQRQRALQPLDLALHDIPGDHDADHENDQQVRALHRFIRAQKPLNRALLLLYLEDRSTREIADILGITETNVATKISRLKQRIRTKL